MSKYRARQCPRCSYFIAFTTTGAFAGNVEKSILNFCLNCDYRFPVRAIVCGARKATATRRRPGLRLVGNPSEAPPLAVDCEKKQIPMNTPQITPADYALHLRAIGQDLEVLHLSQFNLEFAGDAYLVWVKSSDPGETNKPLLRISKSRLQKLWRNHTPPRAIGYEAADPVSPSEMGRRLRYSGQKLDRIEREQRARRRHPSGHADGHSLPQLLRTVGDLVGQRSERLLGISWQELSIGVVVETSQGRKEIGMFRPDNLYDLWVRMYLKRDNRASLDAPR